MPIAPKGAKHVHEDRWTGETVLRLRSVSGEPMDTADAYWKLVATDSDAAASACPGCGQAGSKVGPITIRSIVKKEHHGKLGNLEGLRFSETRDCPLVYYRNDAGLYVTTDEVTKRVGYKEASGDRTICYCLKVSEEKILREIVDESCCTTMEDVREYTRANTGKACEITNPKGVCCDVDVLGLVQKGLRMAGKEALAKPQIPAHDCCRLPDAG